MRVLVVGSGGREHALAWAIARTDDVDQVYVAPGNAGTFAEDKIENIAIAAEDIEGLLSFAQQNAVDLTVIGPEAPLVAGIVDRFQCAGLACFGPSAAAARLEGSKAFCKDFLARHNIPTARYQTFTEVEPAALFAESLGYPVVVKASGLAAGKGVIIAETAAQARGALEGMLGDGTFGEAGSEVVVEEFLHGEEASFIVLASGTSMIPLASSQDHKARDDGDVGPNTGGMGAYSPAPVVTPDMHARIIKEVIDPTLQGLADEGMPFTGFLYAGVMISPEGVPKVLEYNVRFGDPETQPIMMRLRSPLAPMLQAALDGDLEDASVEWDERPCLGVVMAAGGYPASYGKGFQISGLNDVSEPAKVFHAGTANENGNTVTSGGRVLCVCALGDDLRAARDGAYAAVDKIHWQDEYHRSDIGHRALT